MHVSGLGVRRGTMNRAARRVFRLGGWTGGFLCLRYADNVLSGPPQPVSAFHSPGYSRFTRYSSSVRILNAASVHQMRVVSQIGWWSGATARAVRVWAAVWTEAGNRADTQVCPYGMAPSDRLREHANRSSVGADLCVRPPLRCKAGGRGMDNGREASRVNPICIPTEDRGNEDPRPSLVRSFV